jgi:hypothetical protein
MLPNANAEGAAMANGTPALSAFSPLSHPSPTPEAVSHAPGKMREGPSGTPIASSQILGGLSDALPIPGTFPRSTRVPSSREVPQAVQSSAGPSGHSSFVVSPRSNYFV